jgi:prevent-host-death family protein
MNTVNVHEAKTRLSELLRRVEAGEEFVIARSGKPVARLLPFEAPDRPRKPGTAQGLIELGEDFDDPLPDDVLEDFER